MLVLGVFAAGGAAQNAIPGAVPVPLSTQTPVPPTAAPANQASAQETVTVVLRSSLTSKSSREGAEIKATTRKPLTLPDGEVLPRGSMILGHVVQVSQHSKAKPNGAMLLTFHQARSKDGAPIPVTVTILSLADSADAANKTVALPGVRVGGTAREA